MKKDQPWYAVKCLFKHDNMKVNAEDATVYEERIVLIKEYDFDKAIEKAEIEAREYANNIAGCEYVGFANGFHLFDKKVTNGTEIYSLMRESKLSVDDYLDSFYDDGNERTRIYDDK